jgi:hypothetical protein
MTVKRVARENRKPRRGQLEMRERLLPIDRPFDLPLQDLNDVGGREGTEIGVDAEYTAG